MTNQAPVIFQPLIAALQAASSEPSDSLEQQLQKLELHLVTVELDPNVIEAVDLFYALRVLKTIELEDRSNAIGLEVSEDLRPWFSS